jgi:hypothetical protein
MPDWQLGGGTCIGQCNVLLATEFALTTSAVGALVNVWAAQTIENGQRPFIIMQARGSLDDESKDVHVIP